MTDLYYVESPLQLLSAIEASEHGSVSNIFLVKMSAPARKEHNQQLESLIAKIVRSKVIKITWINNGILRKVVSTARLIALILRHKNRIDSFYFGEFRSPTSHILRACIRAKRDVLLDDGTVTLHIQRHWICKGRFHFSPSSLLLDIKIRLFEFLFNVRISDVRAPHLYSIFDLDEYLLPDQINYKVKKVKRTAEFVKNQVYFFGSKYSESGLMRLEDEVGLLEAIHKFFTGREVTYVAHRDDSEEKLNEIQKMGYSIRKLGMPAEAHFEDLKAVPEVIAGFWTTVLHSLSCNIVFKHVISFDNCTVMTNASERERAREIYEYYKNSGISVIRYQDYMGKIVE